MKIREAELADLDELMKFYNVMCEILGEKSFLPEGNKGGFPACNSDGKSTETKGDSPGLYRRK